MRLSKRAFLKVLPLAAMSGVAMKIGGAEVQAHEVKPDKRYIVVIPKGSEEQAQRASALLRDRGINGVVFVNTPLKVYELET